MNKSNFIVVILVLVSIFVHNISMVFASYKPPGNFVVNGKNYYAELQKICEGIWDSDVEIIEGVTFVNVEQMVQVMVGERRIK